VDTWLSADKPMKMGGVVTGAYAPDNVTKILKSTLGLPIHLVSGYKGIAPVRLAAEGGELQGTFGAWYGVRVSWRNVIESGEVNVVLQAVEKPFSDLPDVPLAINLVKTDEARQMIEAGVHKPALFAWPFVLPPGTPKELVMTMRNALEETIKDREFLAEAEKAKMGLDPIDGETLEKIVHGIFKTDPALLGKLKDIVLQ
jgi:tripartite-type tricarboxylate transporter receptor subunit TctC